VGSVADGYDLIIRGGACFDGSGAEPVTADVAIADGRVVEVGRIPGRSRRSIDADGLYVAPGFIDGHTHLDAQIFWDAHGGGLTGQGVTSAVMGNCGFTLAPGAPEQADLVVRSIEQAEEMSPLAIARGVPWTWSGFDGYLDALDALPKALNVAAQVGHSAVRVATMGERAFTDLATDEDLAHMHAAVRVAMAAGSLGFSSSRSSTHTTKAGTPVPSRIASWEEVRRLVLAMAEGGAGMFQFAPERPGSPEGLADFRVRLGALLVESGRPATFLAGGQDEQLATLDGLREQGAVAVGQAHVRGFEAIIGFRVGLPFDGLPAWSEVRAMPLDAQRDRLCDPEVRRRLVDAAEGADAGSRPASSRTADIDGITIVDGSSAEPRLVDVARARGTTPVATLVDLAVASDLEQLFRLPLLAVPDDEVLASLRHPATVVAGSDVGAHVTRAMDGNIPTYLLSHWVRERGAFTWAEAVHMLTARPAQVWGFGDRGTLQVGSHADVVVFDPATVGCGPPRVVDALPDGGPCLAHEATGIHATVVGGQVVMVDGRPTSARPGRLLRHGRSA
jgi:N-acyl-D-amino-acid deacylase